MLIFFNNCNFYDIFHLFNQKQVTAAVSMMRSQHRPLKNVRQRKEEIFWELDSVFKL